LQFVWLHFWLEIVLEGEEPHKLRQFTIPDKTPDERYQTSSVCLSYNVIESLEGLVNVLYKVLDGGPFGLCWVDVSFNAIGKIDEDVSIWHVASKFFAPFIILVITIQYF